MPQVLVISSFVAASRVGGGVAPLVMAPLGVDAVLAPTTLFGRHPGWGRPGGAGTPDQLLADLLEGIEANGLFSSVEAVLTGYFSSSGQVEAAAAAIDRIRAAPLRGAPPLVVVDPIMGDADSGRYVSEDVAAALVRQLVPRADLVACNLWEFGELTGERPGPAPEAIAAAIRASGRDFLVTSAFTPTGAGALTSDGIEIWHAESIRVAGRLPQGPGDVLKARFLAGVLTGEPRSRALARSVGLVGALLDRAVRDHAPEMPLAACADLLREAPEGRVRRIEC